MAQVPECVVCLQPYDDLLNVPRVLACGHSFCELCLMQLQSSWQPSSSSLLATTTNNDDSPARPISGAVIRCPECGHRTRLPIGGQQFLPKNVELLRLLPSLIREPETSLPAINEVAGGDTGNQSVRCLKGLAGKNGTQTSNSAHRPPTSAGRRDHLNLKVHGCVGEIRSGADRRKSPKVGGKGRVDLNHSLGTQPAISTITRTRTRSSVVESWLLPRDLYSDNSDSNSSSRKDVRTWTLPEKSIKLRTGGEEEKESSSSSRFRVVNNKSQKRQLLWGEIVLEQDRLSNSVPVRLRQLTDSRWPVHLQNDDVTKKMTYEDCVLETWEGCPYEVKTELLVLFRVSLLSRGLCNVLGVWMNPQRNALFLVSQLPANQEIVLTWETVRKSFRSAELPTESKFDDVWQSTSGGEATSLSLTAGITPGELGEKDSSSAVEQMRLSRVGLELCSTLRDAHSQGLIFGLLSPNCFVLDRFSSLLIDFNEAMSERSSLHDATTRLRNVGPEEGGCGSVSRAQEEVDGQNYRNCCWRYMSPEALSLLMNDVPDADRCTDDENPSGSSTCSFKKIQNRLTCKTDVWSLGCLLLELMSGKEHYKGYTFSEVLQKVLVERERPGDFLSLLGFPIGRNGDDRDAHADDGKQSPKLSPIRGMAVLLSKCFEYDPEERPELDILIQNLEGLGLSNIPTDGLEVSFIVGQAPMYSSTTPDQHLQSEQAGTADQKYWVLCKPGFVRDGYLDSWYGREDDAQESQRTADDGRELQPRGLEQKGSLEGHRDYVTALAVSGNYLLSASFDKTIRVWSLEDNELRRTLEGHSIVVMALAVDQTTFRCFSGDTGGKICAWEIGEDTAEPLLATWQDHDDWRYTGVASLAVSTDGILYSGSGDRTIKAWSLQNLSQVGIMEGHKGLVSALLVDGELLYSGSWDGTIRVWWRNDQSLIAVLGGGTTSTPSLGGVRTLFISDSSLFVGRDSGAIQVWRDEQCLTTVRAHDTVVSSLYIEGGVLYTGSWDDQIKAWKVDTFLSDPGPILERKCGFALSSIISDGNQLYAGLADRAVKIYSLLGDMREPET